MSDVIKFTPKIELVEPDVDPRLLKMAEDMLALVKEGRIIEITAGVMFDDGDAGSYASGTLTLTEQIGLLEITKAQLIDRALENIVRPPDPKGYENEKSNTTDTSTEPT